MMESVSDRRRRQVEYERPVDVLKELAMTDDLTGLPNRRFVMEELTKMLSESRNSGESVIVILIDLNGFKKVNDRKGHLEGDEVLRRAARALKRAVRCGDILGRYGGDEFIFLKTGAREEALRLVHRTISAVREDTGLELCAGLGCSAGGGDSPEELLEAADLDLRKGKRSFYGAKCVAWGR